MGRKRRGEGHEKTTTDSCSKVHLVDPIPSVKHVARECKVVLWSMVEWVCEAERERERVAEQARLDDAERAALFGGNVAVDEDDMGLWDGLPLAFGPAKKRRKRAAGGTAASSSSSSSSSCYQDNPLYQAGAFSHMAEHNVYLVRLAEDGNFYPARLLGLGPESDTRTGKLTCLVSFLGYAEVVEVPRNGAWVRPVSHNKQPLVASMLQEHERQRYDRPCPATDVHDKYWDQRYRLFSRFDAGVQVDAESWYSVTPECIADYISQFCLARAVASGVRLDTVVDCFSGCGGNTISLARCFSAVLAVDTVQSKLAMLRSNAAVYGVEGRIELVCGDVFRVLESLPALRPRRLCALGAESDGCAAASAADAEADGADGGDPQSLCRPAAVDLLLMSPPWGGPEYLQAASFDLRSLPCGDGAQLLALAASRCANIVYLLPRNSDKAQLHALARSLLLPALVQDLHLHGKHKLTALYLGPLFA